MLLYSLGSRCKGYYLLAAAGDKVVNSLNLIQHWGLLGTFIAGPSLISQWTRWDEVIPDPDVKV